MLRVWHQHRLYCNFSTPLHAALAEGRSQDISRLLIESGADIGNRNAEGKTPMHTFFNPVTASIIIRHPESLHEAIARDHDGMTVVHYIAWSSKSGPEHLSRYHLDGQMSLFTEADYGGRTALHFACQRGNVAILNYLFQLEIHMDIRRCDEMGRTAFHYAVQSKRTEVIDLIFSHDADIRAVDLKGRTVLHHAAMRNNVAAVKRVLELGGNDDLFSADIYGLTPAALAHRYRLHAVAEYLDGLNVNDRVLPPSRPSCDVVEDWSSCFSRQQRQPLIANIFSFLIERWSLNYIQLVLSAVSCWMVSSAFEWII